MQRFNQEASYFCAVFVKKIKHKSPRAYLHHGPLGLCLTVKCLSENMSTITIN